MKLCHFINLEPKDVISIVGAGGKTSFMFRLAEDVRQNNKVLVTTTTKIYMPSFKNYDFLCIGESNFSKYMSADKKGSYVFGLDVNSENKIVGLEEAHLYRLKDYFNYMIIESDGSKMKPVKGWNKGEPVIFRETTKTVGILDIQSLEKKICKENVHRINEFCSIAKSNIGEIIKSENLLNVVVDPKGLFKNSKGRKILFINKSDNNEYIYEANNLKNMIVNKYPSFLDKIIIGSLKNNMYVD